MAPCFFIFQLLQRMNAKYIVLGTAGLGGVWGKTDASAAVHTILLALENGITCIDTAPAYGNAEDIVRRALLQWPGKLPRVNSKVGRLKSYAADQAYYDYSPTGITNSVHHSLSTLGIEALDVLFLHDPEAVPLHQVATAIEIMQQFKQQGLVKQIGLGGNISTVFEPYISEGIFDAIMEFNKLNACNISALEKRVPFCQEANIDYYAASPLNMGLLGRTFANWEQNPPQWLDKDTLATAQQLQLIAQKHHLSLPSLAHRFLLSVPDQFNIVIGASNSIELMSSLSDFQTGPLPAEVYEEILNCIRKTSTIE